MNRLFKTFTLVVACMSMVACARQIDANVYKASHIGETSTTYRGVVISARPVMVEDKEYLEDNTMGMAGGGILGGVLGNSFGSGTGNTLATLAGAAAGAAGGAYAEKHLKTQNAMEYVVELDSGSLKTVVQGPTPALATGQKVLLMQSHSGRSRIQPYGG